MEVIFGTILGRLFDPLLILTVILLVWMAGHFRDWKIVFLVSFIGSSAFALSITAATFALELYILTCAIQAGIATSIWNIGEVKKAQGKRIEPTFDDVSDGDNEKEVAKSVAVELSAVTEQGVSERHLSKARPIEKKEHTPSAINPIGFQDALDICADFGELNENCRTNTFYDETLLPWPKDLIYRSLDRVIREDPGKDITSACFKLGYDLGYFQPNVGDQPINLIGNTEMLDILLNSDHGHEEKYELLHRHLSNQPEDIEEVYQSFEELRKQDVDKWRSLTGSPTMETITASNVIPFRPRK